ncbi:MAG: hypothetical protein JSR60_17175 [Proteobacteria bacterium]|nr:hypothetical protein [Pseudomonadota bacterium]
MFFGIPVFSFVFVHTLITLIAIVSGLLMLFATLGNRRSEGATSVFLIFSVLTAITGFIIQTFPVTPAVVTGVLLSLALIPALLARHVFGFAGAWRWIWVVTAFLSLYLNCFVLVIQSFLKVPALHALAPGAPPGGPVFGAVQGVVLVFFVVSGFLALRRFRP